MSQPSLKEKTAKGLLWGGIGNGALQLLNLAFGIFLSRLLTPADYGMVGALTIFSALAGIFAESGFILAIVNKKEVRHDDYNAVFWFNITVGGTLYLLLFACAPLIARFYHTPELASLARFLFLSFLVGSTTAAPLAYYFRNLMVKERSQIQIAAIIVSGIVGVTCAYCGWGSWGIAVQTVVYSGMNALLIWLRSPWRPTFSFSRKALLDMLPFSSKLLFTSIFTHVNNNIFSVLLGRFYTLQQVGYYTQGSKWTTMGYSTVTGMVNSVGQPVFREASGDPVRLQHIFHKMLRFTAFVSLPAMFGLGLVAEAACGALSCPYPRSTRTCSTAWAGRTSICGIPSAWVPSSYSVSGQAIPTGYTRCSSPLPRPTSCGWVCGSISPTSMPVSACGMC